MIPCHIADSFTQDLSDALSSGVSATLITIIKVAILALGSVEGKNMISADLGKQLESYVTQLIQSGRYGSKSEVLREGVRLIQDRETQLAAMDASIARGLADAEAGRTLPAEAVFDRLAAKYAALADKST